MRDLCGIGRRIGDRLAVLGIETVTQLRDYPNALLHKEFGISVGEKLKRMSFGLDSSPVIPWRNRSTAKSYGHSRTLNKNVTDRNEIRRHILLLSERIAIRMRKDSCLASEVSLWLRFEDFGHKGHSHRLGRWTQDELDIYRCASEILSKVSFRSPVRAIGVSVSGVERAAMVTKSFLEDDIRNDNILKTIDSVNNRFGANVVTRGSLAKIKLKEIVSGMGRDKF